MTKKVNLEELQAEYLRLQYARLNNNLRANPKIINVYNNLVQKKRRRMKNG